MSSRAIDVPPARGAADPIPRARPRTTLVLEPAGHDLAIQPVRLLKNKYLIGSDRACGIHLPAEGVLPRHGEIRLRLRCGHVSVLSSAGDFVVKTVHSPVVVGREKRDQRVVDIVLRF